MRVARHFTLLVIPMFGTPLSPSEHYARCDQIRAAIFEDLAEARRGFLAAMRADRENIFVWRGGEFWVDRPRRLVVLTYRDDPWRTATTLPDDGENGDATSLLEVFGGSSRLEGSWYIAELFAQMIRNVHARHVWSLTATHILNLAVVQPTVNPAFGPLFWLALAHDFASPEPRENFYDVVGPMLVDPAAAPELRGAARARRAQIEFLKSLAPERPILEGERLSEADWVRYCEEQLEAHYAFVAHFVFGDIWSRAGALMREPGARPLPWE